MSTSIKPSDRAWADIDLAALVANARTVSRVSGARLLPMVKADGYGIGAVEVARALEPLDPWGLGVATAEEGIELRSAGISRPIVVFTPLQSSDVERLLDHDLRPVVGDSEALSLWAAAGHGPYHVEIDTGMGRAGFRWDDATGIGFLREQSRPPEGLLTHFHSGTDPVSCEVQWDRFQGVLRELPLRPALVHAANSAAALQGQKYAGDLVRPGVFLYGGMAGTIEPEPVVKLRARIVARRKVRKGDTVSYDATWTAASETTVGTLGIGYADGLPRSLSGRGEVEVDGSVVRILGRVTMDMTMVELPEGAAPDCVATVFGGAVTLDRQAESAGTISYELLTGMGPRVRRRYRRGT